MSVNCDARIKETVTPRRERDGEKRKSERTTDGMGASMRERERERGREGGREAQLKREGRDESLEVSQL